MKTLAVLHSRDLPVIYLRRPNYIYFLYDKLVIFVGQDLFPEHYAIVETMPEEPVEGLWYICMDGYIRSLIDYSVQEIAQVESESMIELLLKAGTVFFYEANRRYYDPRRQLIELPYLNGSYQMTINLANNIKLDKNTVLAFNPETSEFEVSGKPQDYDLIFTHDYEGVDSPTVSTDVTDRRITTEIKISEEPDNIIRVTSDGLLASVQDRVTTESFNLFVDRFERYRNNLNYIIENIEGIVEEAEERISPEAISARILELLESKYAEIDEALAKLNSMSARFAGIEERCIQYTDNRFDTSYNNLSTMIIEATEDPWEDFGDANPHEEIIIN